MEFIKKYKYWIGGVLLLILFSLLFKGCGNDVIKYIYQKPNAKIDSFNVEINLLKDTISTLVSEKKENTKIINKLKKELSIIDKDKIAKDNAKIKHTIDTDSLTPLQRKEYWTNELQHWYLDSIPRR